MKGKVTCEDNEYARFRISLNPIRLAIFSNHPEALVFAIMGSASSSTAGGTASET